MTLVNGVLHKKCRRTKASNEEPLRVVKSDEKQVGLPDGHNLMHTKCALGIHNQSLFVCAFNKVVFVSI